MSVMAEMQRALGRVEGKLDALITATSAHEESREKNTTGFERRLRKIEYRQHWYSGAAAMLGTLLGIISGHKF